MRNKRGKLLGFMLTLALVIGLFPGMSLTVYADGEDITSNITITVSDGCEDDNMTISSMFQDEYTVKEGVTIRFQCSKWWTNAVTIYLNGTAVATWAGSANYTSSYVWTAKKDAKINWANYGQYSANIYLTETDAVAVTGVTLDKESATLTVGGSETLTATVLPANATDKTVKWSVNNSNVALYSDQACTTAVGTDATDKLTVYAKGTSAGSSTVTATSNADSTKTASCAVTVNAAESSTYTITIPDTLTVQNIGWNELEGGITASGDLESGAKLVITASSDTNFNFVKSGDNTAQIPYVFTSRDAGNGKSYSDVQSSSVTSWTFDKLTEAGTSHDVGIVIDDYSSKPAGTYKETVTFTAKVETAQILVTSLELTDDSMFFYGKAWPGVGGNFTLNIRVLPENATNKRLNWSIDGDNCISLSVSDDTLTCLVTGKEPGEANIIVSTTDGSNLSQTFSVEVEEPGEEGGNPEDPGDL